MSGETIRLYSSLWLAIDVLHVAQAYIKNKQMLVFNFVFDLLWTGGGSSVTFLAFLAFRELN